MNRHERRAASCGAKKVRVASDLIERVRGTGRPLVLTVLRSGSDVADFLPGYAIDTPADWERFTAATGPGKGCVTCGRPFPSGTTPAALICMSESPMPSGSDRMVWFSVCADENDDMALIEQLNSRVPGGEILRVGSA